MKAEDFDKLFEYSVNRSRKVLAGKKDEYANAAVSDDRLQNFKRAAAMDGEIPERALWGMLKKHLISIADVIALYETGCVVPTHDQLFEKTGDARNYIHLLEGLFCERIGLPPEVL